MKKSQEDSVAVLAELVLPFQANAAGNVHGGEVIKLMDSTAGVAAQKYCHTNVVTARIDELSFKRPVLIGEYYHNLDRQKSYQLSYHYKQLQLD